MMMQKVGVVAVVTVLGALSAPATVEARHCGARACDTCCQPACPPMATKQLCVQDPCTGCCETVTVCIPACCCAEEPCVTCRPGFLGRKVLTYHWACCDHCVDVVITKHGRVKVRG